MSFENEKTKEILTSRNSGAFFRAAKSTCLKKLAVLGLCATTACFSNSFKMFADATIDDTTVADIENSPSNPNVVLTFTKTFTSEQQEVVEEVLAAIDGTPADNESPDAKITRQQKARLKYFAKNFTIAETPSGSSSETTWSIGTDGEITCTINGSSVTVGTAMCEPTATGFTITITLDKTYLPYTYSYDPDTGKVTSTLHTFTITEEENELFTTDNRSVTFSEPSA